MDASSTVALAAAESVPATEWVTRFLDDLAVVRSPNTVRAYRHDLTRWLAFCAAAGVDALDARPRIALAFVRAERARTHGTDQTVSPRTIVRRLSAVRQWYAYLALEPERTGVRRNPIPTGSALHAGAGVTAGAPALLRYDHPLPQTLSAEDIDRFLACLTATRFRDRAITWLLKDGGLRIGEVLALRVGDINWSKRLLTIRPAKTRTARVVPLSHDAITALTDYVRHERPPDLAHAVVFVSLGRRGFGQPLTYRAWAAVCAQARQAAGTARVHAHAFRHTYATNMAEGGMPLDTLRRVLGHAHVDTVAIYNHIRDTRLRREYDAVMAARNAPRAIATTLPTGGLP